MQTLKGPAIFLAQFAGDEAPFEVHGSPMGLLAGQDPTQLNRLADDLEAQAFVHLTRRLEQSGKA